MSENPYKYTKADIPTITNERIALAQGWQEGYQAGIKKALEVAPKHIPKYHDISPDCDCKLCSGWKSLKKELLEGK